MANSSYSPSAYVVAMHSLPHLNQKLQLQSSQFNFSYDNGSVDSYVQSLLPLPIIIGYFVSTLMYSINHGLIILYLYSKALLDSLQFLRCNVRFAAVNTFLVVKR